MGRVSDLCGGQQKSRTLISLLFARSKICFPGLQGGQFMFEMRVGVLEGCEGVVRWWRDLWIGIDHAMYL